MIRIVWKDRVFIGNVEVSAATDLQTGLIELSRNWLKDIHPVWLEFIIEHEKSHYILQTFDETACDARAFQVLADKGRSLTELVKAITRILNFNAPTEEERNFNWYRFHLQAERAKQYSNKVKNGKR